MSNSQFLVIYSKDADNWSLHIAGPVNESVYGFANKAQAKYVWGIMKRVYNQGRYDEFKDNNKKAKTLMERFGL